jgi:hypothetical protein
MPPKETRMINAQTEKSGQPLWHRLVLENTAVAGNSRIRVFDKSANTDPHLTNLEQGGAMPATSRFVAVAIEIRPRPTCTPSALQKFLGRCRLVADIGAIRKEVVNQPATMFASPVSVGVAGLDFRAGIEQGLYRLGETDQIALLESQPFNFRFEVDAAGFALAAGEVLDVDVILKGGKSAVVPA